MFGRKLKHTLKYLPVNNNYVFHYNKFMVVYFDLLRDNGLTEGRCGYGSGVLSVTLSAC